MAAYLKNRGLLIAVATLSLLIGAVASAQVPDPSPTALAGADARTAMDLANAWKGEALTSFVTPAAVRFAFPDGANIEVPLPESEMVVSVAPYVVNTHPCQTHYMSSCQGELVGVPMRVLVAHADGTVVMDEVRETQANGFIDLWLPRGEALLITFEVDGFSATGIVTTFDDSPTCITTLRLARSGS
ncbi:MAG: CueP family metal-binding protein [Trueperaceae bacterium]|nr:CueP family metal-binding protein [Trueperaceae bacterium]